MRDTGMGQKERNFPGKWGNELQVSFPMRMDGREHLPRHLSGFLVTRAAHMTSKRVSQLAGAISSFP